MKLSSRIPGVVLLFSLLSEKRFFLPTSFSSLVPERRQKVHRTLSFGESLLWHARILYHVFSQVKAFLAFPSVACQSTPKKEERDCGQGVQRPARNPSKRMGGRGKKRIFATHPYFLTRPSVSTSRLAERRARSRCSFAKEKYCNVSIVI